jgi:hypothetical protein
MEEGGLFIWDILRMHVYLDYMWENFKDNTSQERLRDKFALSLKRLGLLLTFLFKKKRTNIFLTNSRDKTDDGFFYDKNANDFLQRLQKDSYVIETNQMNAKKYLYPVALIRPSSLINWLYYLLYRRKDYSVLLEKINTGLQLKWDNKTINRHISYFKSERLIYRLLFKFKRPKRVFVNQNGIQKALFCAARENHVQTVELQHGIIDKGHISYNYPASIDSDSRIYIPDMLLTFSKFWAQDVNYPVKRIIPIGNTVFASIDGTHKKFDPLSKSVGFVSADVFGTRLAELAKEYAVLNEKDNVLFKLHPNEFAWKSRFDELFRGYPNIQVITNEHPTEDIILSCDAIVLIQSTIAYQALQAGIPVFIYKRMTYYRHSHIFESPNVKLIEDARQIVVTGRTHYSKDIFFERFDESVYNRLSNLT